MRVAGPTEALLSRSSAADSGTSASHSGLIGLFLLKGFRVYGFETALSGSVVYKCKGLGFYRVLALSVERLRMYFSMFLKPSP